MTVKAAWWRTDFENARGKDCILLTKKNTITSGEWRERTECWWTFGGNTLYVDHLAGWLPRSVLPDAPLSAGQRQEQP